MGFIVFLAIFADLLAPFDYDRVYFDRVLLMPLEHPEHFLGTDEVGRDYPMIMATFLLVAFLWGILYLLTDIAYTMIDPRVRLGAKSLS